MNLTRKEWEQMWELTHRLELYANNLDPHTTGIRGFLKRYVRFMKDKIQSVIGQME